MPLNIAPGSDFTGSGVSQTLFKTRFEALLTELRTNAAALADLRGFRNRLINGSFACNHRATNGAVADAGYGLDRWYALTTSGNVTVSQQTDQENGAPTSIRLLQPDGVAKRIGLAQAVESLNCRDLRGGSLILTARIRSSFSQPIRWAVLEHTDTADSITRDVVNSWASGTYTPGNFFIAGVNVLGTGSVTPSAATWTSISSGVLTAGASLNNLIVVFWTEGIMAQNNTLDLARVQLEAGAVATPFEIRPIATEKALCFRYYTAGALLWTGHTVSGSSYSAVAELQVDMRAAPTVSLTNTNATNFGTTPGTVTAYTNSIREARTATGSGAANFGSTFTASAEL